MNQPYFLVPENSKLVLFAKIQKQKHYYSSYNYNILSSLISRNEQFLFDEMTGLICVAQYLYFELPS
jgi:hypothetical protein